MVRQVKENKRDRAGGREKREDKGEGKEGERRSKKKDEGMDRKRSGRKGDQWRSQSDFWSCKCKFFCSYRPYKEPISKEMNNDDSNLHNMTKLSCWLRC